MGTAKAPRQPPRSPRGLQTRGAASLGGAGPQRAAGALSRGCPACGRVTLAAPPGPCCRGCGSGASLRACVCGARPAAKPGAGGYIPPAGGVADRRAPRALPYGHARGAERAAQAVASTAPPAPAWAGWTSTPFPRPRPRPLRWGARRGADIAGRRHPRRRDAHRGGASRRAPLARGATKASRHQRRLTRRCRPRCADRVLPGGGVAWFAGNPAGSHFGRAFSSDEAGDGPRSPAPKAQRRQGPRQSAAPVLGDAASRGPAPCHAIAMGAIASFNASRVLTPDPFAPLPTPPCNPAWYCRRCGSRGRRARRSARA